MSARTAVRRRAPAPGLSEAERAIRDALLAVEFLQARMAADSATIRALLAGREQDAVTLAKIRADLADRLASSMRRTYDGVLS